MDTSGAPESSAIPPPQRLTSTQRSALIAVLRRFGVRRAGLFGSFVRGNASPDSDVDLLIQPPPTMSLFGFSELALALEDLLGRPVDLVTYASLHPRLHDSVFAHYDQLFTVDLDKVEANLAR
ncbi:MAG TPA: nucleotidyltransferase family protein [Ktedonobacterales bacterium]|nr:nucleotidyltransferase family protein [Ktedonobacterales bacterium]